MANLKQAPLSYRPFKASPVLADGLLAVKRPGGEVAAAISDAMFGASDLFRQRAEATAARKGAEAGARAQAAQAPRVTVTGGERQPVEDSTIEEGPVTGTLAASLSRDTGGVKGIIAKAAARHGQSAKVLTGIAQVESKLDPKAQNDKSSAGGLFQFVDGTAAQYSLADRFDPVAASDAAARLLRDNHSYLAGKLKRAPTAGELYLAHQQGAAGAVALLSQPEKRAIDVVGRKKVLDNGGDETMTAGTFARLWTAKLGDEPISNTLGEIPEVDMDVAVMEGIRAPLQIEARGGGLAKAGRDTIYGRAFDKAAADAYAGRLEDEMTGAAASIGATFKDDPEGMSAAFAQLREQQLAAHVAPQFADDYEAAFRKLSGRYLATAQAGREEKIKRARADAWASKGADLEKSFDLSLAGLDPGNGDSVALAEGEAARIKRHLQHGVATGQITAGRAKDLAAAADGTLAARFYTAQGEGKTAEEIEALRTSLEADFRAGKLEGVSTGTWDKIDAGLARQATEWQQDDRRNRETFADLTESVLARAAAGYEPSGDELAALEQAAAKVKNGTAVLAATRQTLDFGKLLRESPVQLAEKKLDALRKEAGAQPSLEQVAMLGGMEKMVAATRKSLATDLLGHAARVGVIDEPGSFSDVKSPEDMQALIARRVHAGEQAGSRFGVEPRFFRPGEVKLLEQMAQADPDMGARFASALLQGAAGKAQAVLKEFGRSAPVMAGAGAILAGGGDSFAARDAIAGGRDANGKAYDSKGWQERKQLADTLMGTALLFQPEDEQLIGNTAERIARQRIGDKGLDPKSDEASKEFERALNEAAGAVFDKDGQWGGFADYDPAGFWRSPQKVLVPNSIRADRFGDVLAEVRADDLLVQPKGGMEQLGELWPVLTAKGYVFVDFTQAGEPLPLAGEDGKVFTLDVEKLAPRLRSRVPGAFRGY